MNPKRHLVQKMPYVYLADYNNQRALCEALGRLRQRFDWSERDGLDKLSILHVEVCASRNLSGIFFPEWCAITDGEGRTVRKQLHCLDTRLRSWDLLANECLVAQHFDPLYAAHVASWRREHLSPKDN